MKVKWAKITRNLCRKLWFLCDALHSISTIMHIKFEHDQFVDDKGIFQTSRKCCEKFDQRAITLRHYVVQLWFFHTAHCIIATNANAKLIRLEMT